MSTGWVRHLPEFAKICRQAHITAQAQWILTLTPLKPRFWSTFVQKSSNVSAIVFISDADEIPLNVSCVVLISADLCHTSQRMSQLPCSFLLICVECLSSRAQAQAQALALCNGDGVNLESPRARVPSQIQNLASVPLVSSSSSALSPPQPLYQSSLPPHQHRNLMTVTSSCRRVVLRGHLGASSRMCPHCATAREQTEGSGSRQQRRCSACCTRRKAEPCLTPRLWKQSTAALLSLQERESPADPLMQAIRTHGRLPKRIRTDTKDERLLAENLRRARRAGKLSGEKKAELAAMSANELGTLEEADAPPDPMDPFADEAASRFEQDVLMATNGIRTRTVMPRIARYRKYKTQPAALQMDFVQWYVGPVVQAAAALCLFTP